MRIGFVSVSRRYHVGARRALRSVALYSLLALLAACAVPAPGSYRDAAAPLSASSRFDSAAFAGSWRIVEGFGSLPSDTIAFAPGADGMVSVSGTRVKGVDGRFREGVPGELIPAAGGGSALVVIWVDESRETAAIGTASGSFGALIDRDGRIPPDKTLAARAIFDFYGWDIGQMKKVGS